MTGVWDGVRRFWAVVLLALCASGCASTNVAQTRYRLALVSDTYATALERLSNQEQAWYRAGQVTAADHAAWDRRITRLAIAGKSVNEALRAEANTNDVADRARVVVDLLDDLIAEQVIRLSAEQQNTARILIESARSAIIIYAAVSGDE